MPAAAAWLNRTPPRTKVAGTTSPIAKDPHMRPRRAGWPANRAASTRMVAVRAAKQGSALRSWIIPWTVVASVVPAVPGGYPGLGSVGKIPATIRVAPNTPVRIGAATEPRPLPSARRSPIAKPSSSVPVRRKLVVCTQPRLPRLSSLPKWCRGSYPGRVAPSTSSTATNSAGARPQASRERVRRASCSGATAGLLRIAKPLAPLS